MPKPLCRHIGRCRDIGVRRGGRCRAFSCWTGASSVSCRGGPRRRRAPVTPWASTVMAKIPTHLGLSIRAPPRATFAVIGPTPNGLNTKYRSGMDAAGRAGCPLCSNRSPIPSGSAPEPTTPLGPHPRETLKRLDIWHPPPMSGQKVPDSRLRTRVFDNSQTQQYFSCR